MANQRNPERRIQGMIPKRDYEQMEQLAKINDRSISAEVREAVVGHLVKNGRRHVTPGT
jgi:hypothetical protein